MAITAEERLRRIPREQLAGTPLEEIHLAMLQHFEEDKEIKNIVLVVKNHLDPEHESYVLKPVLPYIQGVTGLGVLWKLFIALGGGWLLWQQLRGHLPL